MLNLPQLYTVFPLYSFGILVILAYYPTPLIQIYLALISNKHPYDIQRRLRYIRRQA